MKNKYMISLFFLFVTSVTIADKSKEEGGNNSQKIHAGSIYSIRKYTISSGGGVVSSGDYILTSSIGQINVGKTTDGNYQIHAGFLQENTDIIFKNDFE